MVLLALCDNANDQGECFPSISMLANKCSMSERSVFSHVASLEADGAIKRENRPGRSTVYHLDPCKFFISTPANIAPQPLQNLQVTPAEFSPTPATVSPPPLQPFHPTPANIAPITINEPSIEPSRNQKEPKKRKVSFDASSVDVPEWLDSEIWSAWCADRKARGKPITETAAKMQIAKLAEMREKGHDPASVIKTSIENGWSGLFEPKLRQMPVAVKTNSRHSGFDKLDYTTGVNDDGTFD